MRKIGWMITLILALSTGESLAKGRTHTRVILDTSMSMQKPDNDPNRLAKLATAMLYDLANPNISAGDTFKIIPFAEHWEWKEPSNTPPTTTGKIIQAQSKGRKKFLQQLRKVTYSSRKTFFYPPLKAAIEDLKGSAGGYSDVRTIVMVTDGVPDWLNEPPNDPENIRKRRFVQAKKRIKDELVPLLEKHNIRLYIMAFGSGVLAHEAFFRTMTKSGSLGKFFTDKDGKKLLRNMLEIFSMSYGYVIDFEKKLIDVSKLELNKGDTPDRVAVVVLSNSSQTPSINIKRGKNTGDANFDGPIKSHHETKDSYSVRWMFSPSKGKFKFYTNTRNGRLAILKPAPVTLKIIPDRPNTTQINRTMASEKFNLKILAKSIQGGDPGSLNITIEYNGPRPDGKKWVEREGHIAGSQVSAPEGRTYDVTPNFKENEEEPNKVYRSQISVLAKRGNAKVGELEGNHSHHIEVWPFLSLSPMPSTLSMSQAALDQRETKCAFFEFVKKGHLPFVGTGEYRMTAFLSAQDKNVQTSELHGASFTLDGLPLNFENTTEKAKGPWYSGHTISKEAITAKHKLCVTIGKPKSGDPNTPISLNLQFTLQESPYDDFKVVHSLGVKLRILGPSPIDKALWYMIPGIMFFTLSFFLWFTRKRPCLPTGLCYSLGSSELTSNKNSLENASQIPALLGFVSGKIISPAEGQGILAWVTPTNDGVFLLKAEKGVRISTTNGEKLHEEKGKYLVEVGETYQLCRNDEDFFLRMEYR